MDAKRPFNYRDLVEHEAAFRKGIWFGGEREREHNWPFFYTLFQPIVENLIGQDAILRIVNAEMRPRR
jgi:hypothetical protein